MEINNSVDFFNLIPNAKEHNLEFVEELNIAMQRIFINTATQWDSHSVLTDWSPNSQLLELVEGNSSSILKTYLKKLVELLFDSNFKLKIPCSTRDQCNLVYNKNSNN